EVVRRALGESLDEYGDKMEALGSKIRRLGSVLGEEIKGMVIGSFEGVIRMIAGLVGGMMGVGKGLGVVGGGGL
ncbi:hypothetical protein, partial [Staphylococcus epidermidis]|uniref:hypothetical protein n=1 Tax=Staphylococcus epidermidis TaxID=1282 RepID=UPI001642F066